jgi:enolase
MKRIKKIQAREILDSRGNPTVEVDVILDSGHRGRMMVPSGASTGIFEALELRDGDPKRYRGKGVLKAVRNVNEIVADALVGMDAEDQQAVDETMLALDGTQNKSNLGANAILGVSLAAAHAASAASGLPLYRYLADKYLGRAEDVAIPIPMVNIISGGLHAGKNIDLQDFLVIPVGAKTYSEGLAMISSVYWKTKDILAAGGYVSDLLADEGGFGPALGSNREALDILVQAMEEAGLTPGQDMGIALDVASSHFYDAEHNVYRLKSEDRMKTPSEMIDMLEDWTSNYPILSIEDGLAEDDWQGWIALTERMGGKVELVGDDFFTTNPQRIQKGIELKAANSVLVKMNQIGTLTETVKAVKLARGAGYRTVISARSGETEDATLADLAVGLNGGQIKIGSVAGSSRLSKYNQLLRIEQEIDGRFAGGNIFRRP